VPEEQRSTGSFTTLVSAAVQVPMWVWAAQTRGWRAADYLGWIVPKPRDVVVPFAVIVALALAGSALQRSGYCGPAPQSFA